MTMQTADGEEIKKDDVSVEVNGKKYVSKEDYNKLMQDCIELRRKLDTNEHTKKTGFRPLSPLFSDPTNVMGLMSVELDGDNYSYQGFSIDYLQRAIDVCRKVKDVDDADVYFCFAKDAPLVIGELDEDKKVCTGVCIAPRIDED